MIDEGFFQCIYSKELGEMVVTSMADSDHIRIHSDVHYMPQIHHLFFIVL